MKHPVQRLLLCAVLFFPVITYAGNLWQQVNVQQAPKNLQLMHPNNFLVYTVDEATLKLQMFSLSNDPSQAIVITLPLPDGSFRDFNVWQTPMMPNQLASQYPDIKTFTGEAVGNATITAKLDFTLYGFHAMIFNGDNTSFIDPYDNYHDGYYMVHYKKDETRAFSDRMKCLVHSFDEHGPAGESMDIAQKGLPKLALKTVNGSQLRTYRLALACDSLYAQAATGISHPTIAQALSKMTTSMNRINGVYEREFSITMNFVTNENAIIFVPGSSDPYAADNNNAGNLLTDNQTECDLVIGNPNYDIGHVFTTGAGGLSDVGVICQSGFKANSTTGLPTPVGDGFDIDYVAHEMGHEYGGDHPFNNGVDGSCFGNNVPTISYEPGSGSTIMAYAGICAPDDLQPHSDAYFHSVSLYMIQQYTTTTGTGFGDVCAVKTSTGNKLVSYAPFAASYSIPFLTPFELDAPVLTDSVADTSTLYCWEERDLPAGADIGAELINTHSTGPIFRSYSPTANSNRIFPHNSMILAGSLSNAGTEDNEGEKVPDVARTLTFMCTFRDIFNGFGSFTLPDDQITLTAINTGTGFAVTSQAATGISYAGASTQTITWNVVGTNTAPISAANVDIYMSVDGGNTWYYHLGTFPNTGSASVTVPNPAVTTAAARFKVKGTGNVFFNVNSTNFTVSNNPSAPISAGVTQVATLANNVNIFPVPASNILHVTAATVLQASIYNTLGQTVWQGQVDKQRDISVALWPKGIYYIQLRDANNQSTVKRFVVE